MKNLEIEYVKCEAMAGANLYNCANDAALIALTENRKVRFVHNNVSYEACPIALSAVVVATGTPPKIK